jgi:hypothetical protein
MKLFDGGLIVVLIFIVIVVAAAAGKAILEDGDAAEQVRHTARCFFHSHNNQ